MNLFLLFCISMFVSEILLYKMQSLFYLTVIKKKSDIFSAIAIQFSCSELFMGYPTINLEFSQSQIIRCNEILLSILLFNNTMRIHYKIINSFCKSHYQIKIIFDFLFKLHCI